jgi:hypothetical protein
MLYLSSLISFLTYSSLSCKVTVKVTSLHSIGVTEGRVGIDLFLIYLFTLRVGWSRVGYCCHIVGKDLDSNCREGWVGTKTGLQVNREKCVSWGQLGSNSGSCSSQRVSVPKTLYLQPLTKFGDKKIVQLFTMQLSPTFCSTSLSDPNILLILCFNHPQICSLLSWYFLGHNTAIISAAK